MNVMSETCPSKERWQDHLNASLPADQDAVLTEHLDSCASCRKTLETLAGGSDSLLAVARQAGDATDASSPALKEIVAQFQAPSEKTQAEPSGAKDESLAFLTPSEKPGCLGRLGHYEVQAIIGKGGFGIVLKAFDEKLHRIVAIKVLSPAYAAIGSARKRFIREARAAAAVSHDHVVGIHAVEEEQNPPYIVMQCIDGQSLQDKLDRKGSLSLKEILRIGLQTAEGLAAAHKQGLVHRDIKPANILLENGVERVKITDFGLAHAVDDASMTQSGTVAGTPMYMSPEQAEGLPIDHRSDLFSLGTVLYAMCSGHPPFRASGTHAVLKRVIDASPRPIREINNETPDWLCEIVAKLHAKKPEDRFQSAKEVAELLGHHLAHIQQPSQAPLPAPTVVPTAIVPGPAETARSQPMSAPGLALVFWPTLIGLFLGAVAGSVLMWTNPAWLSELWGIETSSWLGVVCSAGLGTWLGALVGLTRWVISWWIAWEIRGARKNEEAGPVATARYPAAPRRPVRMAVTVLAIAAVVMVPRMIPAGIVLYVLSSSSSRDPNIGVPPQEGHNLILIRDDPTITFFVNPEQGGQKGLNFDGLEFGTVLPSGRYQVQGTKNGVLVFQQWVTLDANQRKTVHVHSGWVQLFNGKDLTGWKTHPDQPGGWRIADGVLVGTSAKDPINHLFSTRDDYENFHLRAEFKLKKAGNNSGILFRSQWGQWFVLAKLGGQCKVPFGYEADIGFARPAVGGTGSIWKLDSKDYHMPAKELPFEVDTWYTLEIIARGNRVTTKLNGETALDYVDDAASFRKGHLALQAQYAGTEVRFRKIEIKELPPAEPGWVSLFNAKDRTGRVSQMKNPKEVNPDRAWDVLDNILIARGGPEGYLRTEKAYHRHILEMECQASQPPGPGWAGDLLFHIPIPDPGFGRTSGIKLQIAPGRQGSFTPLGGVTPFALRVVDWRTFKPYWNQLRFESTADRFEIVLNGKSVVKFTEFAGGFPPGYFGIMSAGSTGMRYRNIRIKELPPTPTAPPFVIAGTPRLLKTIDNKSTVRALAFTAEGYTLIAGGDHLTFFDGAKGDVLHQEKLPSEITCTFSLSKDRKTLALVYKEAALVLDLPIRKIPIQAKRGLTFSAALSPDGKTLVYADEKILRFHDRTTGKTEEEACHGSLLGLKYSPDGRFLIGINAKELLILDAKTRDLVAKKDIGTPGPGGGVEISQDSKRFVTTGVSGGKYAFYVFSLPDHKLQYLETNLAKAPFSLALSPDGNYLAIGLFAGKGGTVQIWDLAQKKAVASWTVAKVLPSTVAFSPDGKTLVTGSGNIIEVWDLTPEPGWVQLFNGKDLTGWLFPEGDKWRVEKDALIGVAPGYLISNQEYENFHCRINAKFNAESIGSFAFRGTSDLHGQACIGDEQTPIKTGSLIIYSKPKNDPVAVWDKELVSPETWFDLEIIVRGKNVVVKVNGTTTADTYVENLPGPARISLNAYQPGTVLTVSKIEIKELPGAGPVGLKKIEIKELLAANDAEKLFLAMEEKLTKTKTLECGFDVKIDTLSYKGSLFLAEGNRSRLEINEATKCRQMRVLIVSDGARLSYQDNGMPHPKFDDTPKNLNAEILTWVARSGVFLPQAPLPDVKVDDAKDRFRVSGFKLGSKEKVGEREAQRLDYQLAVKGLNDPLSVALWLDVRTGLPVKRIVTEGVAGEKMRVTETYGKLALDEKVDARRFDLPK
jgi:WD40 repeat protein